MKSVIIVACFFLVQTSVWSSPIPGEERPCGDIFQSAICDGFKRAGEEGNRKRQLFPGPEGEGPGFPGGEGLGGEGGMEGGGLGPGEVPGPEKEVGEGGEKSVLKKALYAKIKFLIDWGILKDIPMVGKFIHDAVENDPEGAADALHGGIFAIIRLTQDLMSKDSPYHWKNIRITSDAVGFGFVIRGDGPCYVQAVDPEGPAAVAGLKVRMYIYSVNGKIVLALNHNEVATLIMKGSLVVDLVVLQHFRSST